MNDLQRVRHMVGKLKPGECIEIDGYLMSFAAPGLLGGDFSPCDWVLEGIVGSAYGWSYERTMRGWLFRRSLDTETRTYISPDQKWKLNLERS